MRDKIRSKAYDAAELSSVNLATAAHLDATSMTVSELPDDVFGYVGRAIRSAVTAEFLIPARIEGRPEDLPN